MIQILVFARLRDRLGDSVINLPLDSPARLAEIRAALQQQYPHHADELAAGKALFAVNQTLTHDDTAVATDKDEVALFPPMTGG